MSSPIRELLATLHRHSEVVEQALSATVLPDAGASQAAISALRQASALRAAGEEGYRLHPRLREYLFDHLQLFPAYQELAEIGSKITQVSSLWNEIELVRGSADAEAIDSLTEGLNTTVYDIADNMDGNVLWLQTLMSTRFGNVKSAVAKKSQNRFYQQQSATLALDLARLARVVANVERDADARGMHELSRFLRRNCLTRILGWQQSLSEIQTEIRAELYRTRVIEKDLKQLSRMDMLLQQQPAWQGFTPELEGDIPDFLLLASLPALAPHVEPMDRDRQVIDELEALARALPPRQEPAADREPPRRYKRIVDEDVEVEETPAAQALSRLAADVRTSAGTEGLSLVGWRDRDEHAQTMRADVWLAFAVAGLRSHHLHVELVNDLPAPSEKFSHTFHDALAFAVSASATSRPAGEIPVPCAAAVAQA